jgi:hypothetical protein
MSHKVLNLTSALPLERVPANTYITYMGPRGRDCPNVGVASNDKIHVADVHEVDEEEEAARRMDESAVELLSLRSWEGRGRGARSPVNLAVEQRIGRAGLGWAVHSGKDRVQ